MVKADSPITVHYGVKPMGNGDHCCAPKLSVNGVLDEVVGGQVYRRGCFIQNQHLALAQKGTSEAHQLPLASTACNKHSLFLIC